MIYNIYRLHKGIAVMVRLWIVLLLQVFLSTGCETVSQQGYPPDWPEKMASTSQCPDISGIYCDRASETYSTFDLGDNRGNHPMYSVYEPIAKDELCHQRHLNKFCWLSNWFGEPGPYRGDICASSIIKISQINIKDKGWQCENGSIVVDEEGSAKEMFHSRMEIFPAVDGSLVLKNYDRGVNVVLPYIIPVFAPPGPVAEIRLYRWNRVDSGAYPNDTQDYERLMRYLKGITEAYSEQKISEESYKFYVDRLIQKHGQDKVNKALQEIQK